MWGEGEGRNESARWLKLLATKEGEARNRDFHHEGSLARCAKGFQQKGEELK